MEFIAQKNIMNKFSFLKNFLFQRHKKPIESDKIFSFLASISHHPDAIENYLFQYSKLKRKYRNKNDEIFISLYLNWEEFIVNNKTKNYKNYTIESLRESISKEIGIRYLSEPFKLIFLPKKEQSISLYKQFVIKLSDYINTELGHAVLVKSIKNIQDPFLTKIKITENGLSFELIDEEIKKSLNFQLDSITNAFKNLVNILYNAIEISLGNKITHDIFNSMFMEFKQRYNTELTSSILKIIPERILGMDEWLSLMSKKELEKQVVEKTEELSKLNQSLEDTVQERTAELQKAYNDLKLLDQKKSDFISVAAHQLRTPLSGMKWGLTMLSNGEFGKLTKEQKDFIDKNIESNNKIINILNDLLEVDLSSKNKDSYNFENYDIGELISETVNNLANLAKRKSVNINWKKSNEKISAEVDIKKIHVVLQNILDNAIKYSNKNTNIDVNLNKINTMVQVSIKNTGIGIQEEDKDEIFERFFRSQNAMRQETEGSGLGLYITKQIIEDHNGRIWFDSNNLGETTFYISIPATRNKIPIS